MSSEQGILIGKVLAPHGIGGQVRVYPYSDFPERITLLKEVVLLFDEEKKCLNVEKASLHGKFWLLKFTGIDDREEAEKLRNYLVFIARDERMPLPEDAYYYDQLIGLEVYTAESGKYLGQLSDVRAYGAHDQLVIKMTERPGKEAMIPAIKDFVKHIDLPEGRIVVSLPEGLLDL